MADNRQYMALEWVIRDIKDTLAQAQRALDAYERDSGDVIQLKFCLTYVHQVYGSLHMAGFHGGAMIASEVEALAQSLLDDAVPHKKEAMDVLQKAIVELPAYLESALETKTDQPSLVFSLLNDLRATRGANFISECALFSPKLDYAYTLKGVKHPIVQDQQQFKLMLSKLRQMYQVAAASVIHKKNVEENFAYLSKVSQRLEKLLQGTQRLALWEIFSAFIIGLQKNIISDNASIKKLLRELDGELKLLVDGGVVSLDTPTSEELIKNFLYYLTFLSETTPEIDFLIDHYKLNEASSMPNAVGVSSDFGSAESYELIVSAILEEFVSVKEKLVFCQEENNFFDNLDIAQAILNRVADTLAMLSVGQLRQQVLGEVHVLAELKNDQSESFEKLAGVLENISAVERELECALLEKQRTENTSSRQFSDNESFALQESRNGLEEAKDSVVNYIATQWNIKNLQPVPEILRGVSEKLLFLSLRVPAEILSACASYIEMTMIHQANQPEWTQLDSLADVITSIDYFLEVLSLTKEEDFAILLGAEKGLVNLGVPQHRVQSVMQGVASAVALKDGGSQRSIVDSSDEVESDVDDEMEAEIIEIFVEEAGEVQETIAKFLPAWEHELKDRDALVEVRRAFHTLKGSGRIVKAVDIGELSWSIENMLNRVLDDTLEPDKIQVSVIRKVLSLLPDMVEAFSEKKEIEDKAVIQQCQMWAESLAKNDIPQSLIDEIESDHAANECESEYPENNVDEQEEDIDVQLWEIFGSEAETHLIVIREYILEMESVQPFFETPTDAMQRAMHTLKGSAHMAEITPIAELMTPMELFVKDLRAYQVIIDEDILQLIKDSVSYTEDALEQISRLIYPKIEKLDLFLARVAELRERSVGHLIKHEQEEGPKVDPAFLEMLMNDGMNLLLDIDSVIGAWKITSATDQEWRAVANELANVQHGAERANLDSMVQLSEEIYKQYEGLIAKSLIPDDELYDVLLDAHYALLDIIDAIAGGQDLPEVNVEMIAQLQNLAATKSPSAEISPSYDSSSDTVSSPSAQQLLPNHDDEISDALESPLVALPIDEPVDIDANAEELDDEIIEIFMEEAGELIEDIDATIDEWESGGESLSCNENLQRLLHTFKGGARLAGLMKLGDLAHNFESYLVGQFKIEPSGDLFSVIHQYQDQLIQGVNTLGQSIDLSGSTPADQLSEIMLDEVSGTEFEQDLLPENQDIAPLSDEKNNVISPINDAALIPHDEVTGGESSHIYSNDVEQEDFVENEIVTDEVINQETINDKESDNTLDNNVELDNSENESQDVIGNMSDSAESDKSSIDPIKNQDGTEPSTSFNDEKSADDDSLLSKSASNIVAFPPAVESSNVTPRHVPTPQLTPSPTVARSNQKSGNVAAARRAAPQETVKVSAELMEELVNLAGETSISRGRMEEQMSDLSYSLEEMEQTVGRLEEQLRRLDIETEAQVIFRQEQLGEKEDFDPLEMDRYSQLQQLSRSLIESASDLKDLKITLTNKARDAETVLLQQSRINTELQEGLMRSRMVPFSRIVPRLRRIVRQIATELGKQVSIEFDHTEGELDRNMMERMVAPLEHMLRNAVDHGIESVEVRRQRGKPVEGRIRLSLSREGGNVLLRLSDDGAGMSVERIREKAIQQELMNRDAALSDQEILQFIFQAGFSTAESVTQISGRGVGMDVVNSEIKQLGGSVTIESIETQGTQFNIRLPFTVSVNRALMISMGDDRYAIPLNSIEGIARIAPDELGGFYSDPDRRFHYAGNDYQLQYLGSLLHKGVFPKIDGHKLPVPVLLVRNADHSVAIQVDALNGSQEIVVKALGSQFSSVQGLSGATIMGDGNVVVILDTNAMIRRQYLLTSAKKSTERVKPIEQVAIDRNPLIMVVDDSVTVRKVTTRFLEREGFDVITAKDGMDAIEMLRDQVPDIMLLDIEMPRMDGFEVARRVRATSTTQNLPIIMITSRTGEKHRQTGLAAGANEYMGKPFQEDALLENIRLLLPSERR